jgi:tRNA threonylcarbamoyladenosine biosynthesis protein TsaB
VRIVAIETSTDTASLACWSEGALVWGEDFPAKRSLCADLAPRLAVGLGAMGGVDRIVVGLGPGSYAGVRIAIATAMGLQAALGCELLGVPSAVAMQPFGAHFTVAGDARRGTWYFSEVREGRCVVGPELLDSMERLLAKVAESGVPLVVAENAGWCGSALVALPRASILAQAVAAGAGIVQVGSLEPLYLRDAHITRPKPASPLNP